MLVCPQIKAEGARGLAHGLHSNSSLARLALAWNGLDNAGGCAFGEMLAVNMGLHHLDLQNTRLASRACVMLGDGIKANVVLQTLLLAGNALGAWQTQAGREGKCCTVCVCRVQTWRRTHASCGASA